MTHEEKKVGKIIEELTMFFFSVGAEHIQTGIDRTGNQVIITMESDYAPDREYGLLHLKEYLNEPKNDSVEDIYWELAGSGDPGESNQLLLLGMMLDKAEVDISPERVKLKLYKELLM